jgi:hypothetical protein
VQALDVAPLRGAGATDAASKAMLLLGVAIRGYYFRLSSFQSSDKCGGCPAVVLTIG